MKRGVGDPTEEWEDKQVSTYAQSKYGERVCIEVSVRDRHNSLSWAAKHGRVDLVSELLSRPGLYSLSTPSFEQLEDAIAFAKQAEHWDVVRVLGEDPRVDASLCGPDWEPLVQMSGEFIHWMEEKRRPNQRDPPQVIERVHGAWLSWIPRRDPRVWRPTSR